MKLLLNGAWLAALLFAAVPSAAEAPMTPARPLSTPSTSPWVEPPSAPHTRTARAAPAAPAADDATTSVPGRSARSAGHARRRHYSRWAGDHMARQLNRWQLRGGYYAAVSPYYGGFGPAPYSDKSGQ